MTIRPKNFTSSTPRVFFFTKECLSFLTNVQLSGLLERAVVRHTRTLSERVCFQQEIKIFWQICRKFNGMSINICRL